jgi:hypothetical protein
LIQKKWVIETPGTTTVYSGSVLRDIREVMGKQ